MAQKYNLLIIFTILFIGVNSFGQEADPIFSVIESSSSEQSPETLPDTYEEPDEEYSTKRNEAATQKLLDDELYFPRKKNTKDEDKSQSTYQVTKNAEITALNKITAKSQTMIIKVGEAHFFGNIEIKIHRCLKSTDPYKPENKILLSVTEHKVDEDPLLLFQGWMVSSNIGYGVLEHAVYEVFSEECS